MFDVRYTNDIVLLIWMGVAFFMSQNVTKKKVTILGQEEERYSLLFAVVVFFPLFWFVTTVFARSDMYAYWSSYEGSSMSIMDVIRNWNSIDKGPGYSLVQAFARSIGVSTFQEFRLFITMLYSIPLVLVYRFYSEDYVYSIFLLIATMSYDSWMMNGMRQFLAAVMIFAALPLLLKKHYILVLMVILAAMTVHKSAMLMIPVFIVSQFKPWSRLMIFSMIIFAVVLYIYIGASDWMSEETKSTAEGSNPLRTVISAIPVVIAFVGRKQISLANNRMINICVNVSVTTVIMYALASVTSGVMVGRLPGYTTIFNYLLFPYLLKKVFNETVSKNLKIVITLLYIVYFIADLYFI